MIDSYFMSDAKELEDFLANEASIEDFASFMSEDAEAMEAVYDSVLEYSMDMALEAAANKETRSKITVKRPVTNKDTYKKKDTNKSSSDKSTGGTRPKGKIISKQVRDGLPASAFGIPSEKKYPLIVKGDNETTKELISRAIQFFNFCKTEWRSELAHNIIKAIDETGVSVKIHPKSYIHKFVNVPNDLVSADIPNKYRKPK